VTALRVSAMRVVSDMAILRGRGTKLTHQGVDDSCPGSIPYKTSRFASFVEE
jgi:hypothetical protein